jgi:hypothetical protein
VRLRCGGWVLEGGMTKPEARVVIDRMQQLIDDLRDMQIDMPQHVQLELHRHIENQQDAIRELRKIYEVTV